MSEKVKLTREQADSLIIAKEYMEPTSLIIMHHEHPNKWRGEHEGLNGLPLDAIIRALYIGYEVEETTEEKIKTLYEQYSLENDMHYGYRRGIRECLNALGKQIEGVNI